MTKTTSTITTSITTTATTTIQYLCSSNNRRSVGIISQFGTSIVSYCCCYLCCCFECIICS